MRIALFALLPLVAAAQSEYSARAVQLQRDGDFAGAQQALRDGRQACRTPECRALFYYTAGYIHQRQSAADPAQAGRLLERAGHYYQEVLQTKPNHGPTLSNLAGVLKRLGDRRQAIAYWNRAVKADPDRAARYYLLIGDTFLEASDWARARGAYRRAIASDPDDATAMRRLIDVYQRQPDADVGELVTICQEWADRSPEVAVYGFGVAVALSYEDKPDVAETSLVEWAKVVAATRSVAAARAKGLPAAWDHSGPNELRTYFAAPWNEPNLRWWRETIERRDAFGRLALAVGSDPGWVGRDPARAEAIWKFGVAVCPSYEEYAESGRADEAPSTWLDLQTALAMHYHKYPSVDRDGRKFREIEDQLFRGKAIAYQLEDHKSIQRHHTILGLIYADRGQWTSSRQYRNGIFQLSAAIDRANRRGFYQPLPELKSKLANGYLKTNSNRQATRTLVSAMEAFLDTDDLDQAQQTYRTLRRISPSGLQNASQLARILESRQAVASGRIDAVVAPSQNSVLSSAKTPWLYPGEGSTLAEVFLARQRFKIAADVASKSESGAVQLNAAAEALRIAGSGSATLVGTADILRLRKADAALTRTFQLPKPRKVEKDVKRLPNTGKSVPVYLPNDNAPRFVHVGAEHLLAGAIVQQTGADTLVSQKTRVQVRGKEVKYSTGSPAADLSDRLRRVEGVSRVERVPQKR